MEIVAKILWSVESLYIIFFSRTSRALTQDDWLNIPFLRVVQKDPYSKWALRDLLTFRSLKKHRLTKNKHIYIKRAIYQQVILKSTTTSYPVFRQALRRGDEQLWLESKMFLKLSQL